MCGTTNYYRCERFVNTLTENWNANDVDKYSKCLVETFSPFWVNLFQLEEQWKKASAIVRQFFSKLGAYVRNKEKKATWLNEISERICCIYLNNKRKLLLKNRNYITTSAHPEFMPFAITALYNFRYKKTTHAAMRKHYGYTVYIEKIDVCLNTLPTYIMT